MTTTTHTATDIDTTDNEPTGIDGQPTPATDSPKSDKRSPRRPGLADRQISLRTTLIGLVAVIAVAAIATLGALLFGKTGEVNDLSNAQADRAHAEKVALDYATGAANMDYKNADDWRSRLTEGTSPELSERLRKASVSMEQLITPLQWTSTADPIAAKVESVDGGVYRVVAFVNVMTKNAQAPDGIESTATYQVSIDPAQDWEITEISGIGSGLDGDQGSAAGDAATGEARKGGQTPPAPAAPTEAPAEPGN